MKGTSKAELINMLCIDRLTHEGSALGGISQLLSGKHQTSVEPPHLHVMTPSIPARGEVALMRGTHKRTHARTPTSLCSG